MCVCETLKINTIGLFIFKVTKSWYPKNQISLVNLVSCVTGGVSFMLGKQNEFSDCLKKMPFIP